MPQKGTILGDFVSELGEQGKNIAKETATEIVKTPINILEGLAPPTPEEARIISEKDKQEKQAKLPQIRSGLSVMQEARPKPQEDRRIFQGAEKTERGMQNQNAKMNNSALSANMTPKKKIEPLVVQQKRQNKLQGAG